MWGLYTSPYGAVGALLREETPAADDLAEPLPRPGLSHSERTRDLAERQGAHVSFRRFQGFALSHSLLSPLTQPSHPHPRPASTGTVHSPSGTQPLHAQANPSLLSYA